MSALFLGQDIMCRPEVYLPYLTPNIKMVSRTEATVATQQISKYTHRTPSLKFNS